MVTLAACVSPVASSVASSAPTTASVIDRPEDLASRTSFIYSRPSLGLRQWSRCATLAQPTTADNPPIVLLRADPLTRDGTRVWNRSIGFAVGGRALSPYGRLGASPGRGGSGRAARAGRRPWGR